MARTKRLSVAVVGMRFGASFVPIYRHHPDIARVAVIDPDTVQARRVARMFDTDGCYAHLEDILDNHDYDAVHLITPIPLHAQQAVAALRAGKHCACTVPMATSLADVRAIVRAQRASRKNYMMMETAVYTRQFLLARQMKQKGEFGRIQFLRGAHYQDMENWPSYWMGLPPMWYATHAVSPCLAIAGCRAVSVQCRGSGMMRRALHKQYGNPFPVESALFELATPSLGMEVTRALFHCSRGYTESFNVYGEQRTFEWAQIEQEDPVVFETVGTRGQLHTGDRRGLSNSFRRVDAPDRQDLLPEPIRRFTVRGRYDDTNPHKTFDAGGGHHGSHPHLVHEFVRSIVEKRKPWINEVRAADWTAAGLCAHASAMACGRKVVIPEFSS